MAKNDRPDTARPTRGPDPAQGLPLLLLFLVLLALISPLPALSDEPPVSMPAGTRETASVMKLPEFRIQRPPAIAPSDKLPVLPDEIPVPPGGFTLPELVDIALRYSPASRRGWASVLAAEAAVGVSRSAYYPAIQLIAQVDRVDGPFPMLPSTFAETYGDAAANLSFLLFDFGGRRAQVDASRRAQQARSGEYDQIVQDVVYGVARSYYELIGALAALDAAEDSLQEAETNLASAEAMLKAGLGTITDVLLTRAQRAEQVLWVVGRRGDVAANRGALATAVGLPANTFLDVSQPSPGVPFEIEHVEVEALIQQGLKRRPDLGATWARMEEAQSNVRQASSSLWPALEVEAQVGWLKGDGFFDNDFSVDGMIYTAGVVLSYPLFEGFALRNAVRQSKALAEEARAALRGKQESVILQVWDSYQRIVTAGQRIEASIELLQSAQMSYASALTAYRAGLTTITELVQAQTTLSDARFARVDAGTTWHVALVQLARDTGQIPLSGKQWVPGASPAESSTAPAASPGERPGSAATP